MKKVEMRERIVRHLIGGSISHELNKPIASFSDYAKFNKKSLEASTKNANEQLQAYAESVEGYFASERNIGSILLQIGRDLRTDSASMQDIRDSVLEEVGPRVVELREAMRSVIVKAEAAPATSKLYLKRMNRCDITLGKIYAAIVAFTNEDVTRNERTNLEEQVRDQFRNIAAPAGEIHLQTTGNGTARRPTIEGNHSQIISILQNLISNALRFASTTDNPYVAFNYEIIEFRKIKEKYPEEFLDYSADSFWVEFHIVNNGEKIPPDKTKTIFRLYEALKREPDEKFGGGTGIGLAVAKFMAIDHGGKIFVNVTNKDYTDFCLCLPLAHPNRIDRDVLFKREYEEELAS